MLCLGSKVQNLQAQPHKHLTWLNAQLRRKGKLVISDDSYFRPKSLSVWHYTPSGGHSGIDATNKKVMAYFYWKCIQSY